MLSQYSIYKLLEQRKHAHIDCKTLLQDQLSHRIYRSFCRNEDLPKTGNQDFPYGSIYNVEFIPTGNAVIACHANKAITLHDTRLEKQVLAIPTAHHDGVNVVTFLDSSVFATGSDDSTVRIWDIRRFADKSLGVLKGHKGWVKNVEVDHKSGVLFSIAFTDGVRKWNLDDLDSYQSEEIYDNLIFNIKYPVRLRISPDSSTMVISMRRSHLFVVSNFDGCSIDELWNSIPQNYPPLETDISRLSSHFKDRKKNIPCVHEIGPSSEANYRTPLSLTFHESGQYLAMRMIDVKANRLTQEISVLYKMQKEPQKYFYNVQELNPNFLNYIDEYSPHSVLDFIKEISFSSDGRIIVSPFGDKVRLFSVDHHCTPIDLFHDDRYQSTEKELKSLDFEEVAVYGGHCNGVLTCRLNSWDMCLVSGDVDGRVVFNRPRL